MGVKFGSKNLLVWLAVIAAAGPFETALHAQVLADVEYSIETSPSDPHPLTYTWAGEIQPITDPGVHFYHPFYIGTVNSDARVPEETRIDRVMVSDDEWVANRKWIITKLTLYYQLTRNLEPSAYYEITGGPAAAGAAAGTAAGLAAPGPGGIGQPGFLGAPPAASNPMANAPPGFYMPGFETPAAPAQPSAPSQASMANPMANAPPGFYMPGFETPGAPAQPATPAAPGGEAVNPYVSGGPGAPEAGATAARLREPLPVDFSPSLAAEWTFYYDQLVLWQYYCNRNLLNAADDETVEGLAKVFEGEKKNEALSNLVGSTLTPAQGGAQGMGGAFGAAAPPPPGAPGLVGLQMPGAMGGMGMMGMGATGTTPAAARETFNPEEDYFNPDRNEAYRAKFQEAAQDKEQDMYTRYVKMILSIEDREANQERYDQWFKDKREQVEKFADSWRKVEEGDTLMIDGQLFLVTKEPLENVPYDAKNVVVREQLTPQDLLNPDGTLKKPEIQ